VPGIVSLVRIAAIGSGGASLGLSFISKDMRIWAFLLVIFAVTGLASIMRTMVGQRIDNAYVAMARALISRPAADLPDGPGRVVALQRGRQP
jgi:hypothetical protein